jgi:hypothetical protein
MQSLREFSIQSAGLGLALSSLMCTVIAGRINDILRNSSAANPRNCCYPVGSGDRMVERDGELGVPVMLEP